MKQLHVRPSHASGTITAPASKSQTLRAIVFATLAKGISHIDNCLDSPDTHAMITACQALGADIKQDANRLTINGISGKPKQPDDVIDAGNSGQVLRFVGALCALQPHYCVITGDWSIRHNRPAAPLLEGLQHLGALAISCKNDGYAPLIIKGPLKNAETQLDGQDSQPVSALLIACAFASGPTTICVRNPGETPWVALTLDWFDKLELAYSRQDFSQYSVPGNATLPGFDYTVPGDFSTAAFLAAAAVISGSAVTLKHMDDNDAQGDKQFFSVLAKMGASVTHHTDHTIHVAAGDSLHGIDVDINEFVDAIAILAVLACYAQGTSHIRGAAIARHKESDRLHAISTELGKMGAHIETTQDGLIITGTPLHGAKLASHDDHRIAMALAVAALGATGNSVIMATDCIRKTYPDFVQAMRSLGANIEELS